MNDAVIEKNGIIEPIVPVDPELEEMMRIGIHWGHSKSKNHPSMAPFTFGVRNTVSIIDLTATKERLAKACEFLKTVVGRGGSVLLVGTRPSARNVIKDVAARTGMPYFTERWVGGTLTNFREISRRVAELENLERERATGGFEKYTKKERLMKDREIARLTKLFDGLRTLKRTPDAIFIVDITYDETALAEAMRRRVPVVALVDTNSNAAAVDYPVPSNDDAVAAVQYMVGRIGAAIEEGKRLVAAPKAEGEAAPAAGQKTAAAA